MDGRCDNVAGWRRGAFAQYAPAIPFAVWIGLQCILPQTAAYYALRSGATLAALAVSLALSVNAHSLSPLCVGKALVSQVWGIAVGIAVAAMWILPEHCAFYREWILWPFGVPTPEPSAPSPYAPEACGWALTWAKLAGSAFVIAPVEEWFFRSFLYRWIQRGRNWRSVDMRKFDMGAFLWTVALFSLEHSPRFAVAAACGAMYQILAIRRGLAAAVTAHVTTNLLLALYVIRSGDWGFW